MISLLNSWGRVSRVAHFCTFPMIKVPLMFYDAAAFFVAKLGGERDVTRKSCVFSPPPVAIHTVRSFKEGEVTENVCFPKHTTIWIFNTDPFRVQMF